MRSTAMWSASAVVPTRKEPAFAIVLQRVVGGQRAVLDAVDPGPDAGADAGVAVGVRRHAQAVAVGLVDDGVQLLVGVLLAPGGGAERHDAARRRDLDQLGAVLDLVAHGLAHLGHAVGDALLDALGHDPGRQPLEHGRIEVAAGRGDGVAGREDARAREPAVVDRLHEVDVEQEARPCTP